MSPHSLHTPFQAHRRGRRVDGAEAAKGVGEPCRQEAELTPGCSGETGGLKGTGGHAPREGSRAPACRALLTAPHAHAAFSWEARVGPRRPAAPRTCLLCPSPPRGQRCVTWSYVLIPSAQPGVFSVQKKKGETGVGGRGWQGALAGGPLTGLCPPELGTDTEEVWVHETNYSAFALMSSRRRSVHRSVLRVHLLCEPLPSSSLPAAGGAGAGEWPPAGPGATPAGGGVHPQG